MPSGGVIDVVLADDHPVVRAGIATVLEGDPYIRVVGQAASAEEAISEVERCQPRVAVLDVRLGEGNGVHVGKHLLAHHPGIRVMILTQFASTAVVRQAFALELHGFVVKESEPAMLREAVRELAEGNDYVDPAVAPKLVELATHGRRARGPYGLTLQEMVVIEYVPKGLSNSAIGAHLGVSAETVKSHLRSVMRKLGVTDRAQLAAMIVREGLA